MIYRDYHLFKASIPDYGRILSIDYGTQQIGLATSDPMRIIASSHSVFNFSSYKDQIIAIQKVVESQAVSAIIIGWPLMPDGTEGEMCLKILDFLKFFQEKTDIPIYLQDERYSSQAVNRALKEMDLSRKKRSKLDDKIAASYILQTFLDKKY